MQREGFPWRRVMRLGMGVLRLPPDQFWRMTLKELVAAFQGDDVGMHRSQLDGLMQRFPD